MNASLAKLVALLPLSDTTILIRDGLPVVKRGNPPAGLVNGLAEMARKNGIRYAVIHASARSSKLSLKSFGIPDKLKQRCRNIWLAYR